MSALVPNTQCVFRNISNTALAGVLKTRKLNIKVPNDTGLVVGCFLRLTLAFVDYGLVSVSSQWDDLIQSLFIVNRWLQEKCPFIKQNTVMSDLYSGGFQRR